MIPPKRDINDVGFVFAPEWSQVLRSEVRVVLLGINLLALTPDENIRIDRLKVLPSFFTDPALCLLA